MNPQHKNPTRRERTATAPYNFVPLPEKVIAFRNQPGSAIAIDQSVYHDDRFTGWIDVELETLSPIYIRAGLTPKQYEKMERQEKDPNDRTKHLDKVRNRPEFAHAGDPDVPVIPGSSLRGMIRTLCEIIGHGKLAPAIDQALAFRALSEERYRLLLMEQVADKHNTFIPKMEGGYIREEPDGWYIQPAERLDPNDRDSPTHARVDDSKLGIRRDRHGEITNITKLAPFANRDGFESVFNIYAKFSNYDFVAVRKGRVRIKRAEATEVAPVATSTFRPAVLTLTGPVPRKHSETVLFPPADVPKSHWIRIPNGTGGEPDLVAAYLNQVSKTGKSNQKQLLGSDQGVLRDGYPVMYIVEGNKLLFFGHTQMFRMPYKFSPHDLLPRAHKDEGTLDLAQAMFGTVRTQTSGAAGRIFVEDARLHPEQDRDNLWLDDRPVVMPKILGSPKPTTFQHYLTQPNPDADQGRGLKTYNDREQTTLRGHKLYWHGPETLPRSAYEERRLTREELDADKQHTRIKPVRPGVRFCFRIRFDNLLSQELGLLLWAIKLPAPGKYAHKLGMGKPLGLGSVRLRHSLTVIEPKIRYESFLDVNHRQLVKGDVRVIEEDAIKDFETLAARALQLLPGESFSETLRMRSLLTMLGWPGPDSSQTRYMSIGIDEETNESTGRNEFKERPVLPDPLGVVGKN